MNGVTHDAGECGQNDKANAIHIERCLDSGDSVTGDRIFFLWGSTTDQQPR